MFTSVTSGHSGISLQSLNNKIRSATLSVQPKALKMRAFGDNEFQNVKG